MTTPADLPSLISEGRRLIEEARYDSAEPWRFERDEEPDEYYFAGGTFDVVGSGLMSSASSPENECRARLAAFAVNSFPLLLAVAEAAEKVHGYLEEELLEARGCVGQGEVTGEACEWHRLLLALDAALRGEVKP